MNKNSTALFLGGIAVLVLSGVFVSVLGVPSRNGGAVANATEVQSGALGVWTKNASSLPAPVFNAKSVAVNDYLFVFGGTGSTTIQVVKTKNGGSVGPWVVSSSSLPKSLSAMGVAAANGYVYVVGGIAGTSTQTAVYYAPVSSNGSLGAWVVSSSSLPEPRSQTEAVIANGYIYVTGGNSTNLINPQNSVFYAKILEDGSVGSWQTATPLSTARRFHGSVAANGYLYVTGGFGPTNGALASVSYAPINSDGSLGAWVESPNPLPVGRGAHQSVVMNGYLYATGGINVKSIDYAKLNPDGSNGTWSTNPYNPSAILFSVASVVNRDYLYLIGGTLYTGGTNLVFYAPTARVKSVLMFGDSITRGLLADPDSSYPALIQAVRPDLQIVNAGVPGINSYTAASTTLTNLLNARPYDAMTLLIGINDPSRNGFPIDPIRYTESQQTANNILQLAAQAHSRGVKDVYVMTILPAYSIADGGQKLVQYFSRDVALWETKLMYDSAANYPYIHFVDMRDEFSREGWQNFTTDGVHPTLSGRQKIADFLSKNIPIVQ